MLLMTDSVPGQRSVYGVACTVCRRAKVRCVSSSFEGNRCDRCARLQKDCIFMSHRRGLWRRERNASRSDNQGGPPHINKSSPETFLAAENSSNASRPSSAPSGSNCASGLPLEGEHTAWSSPGNISSDASFAPQSFIMHSEDTRGLSLYTALDPNRVIIGNGESTHAAPVIQDNTETTTKADPIDLNLISHPSAQFLFEGFYKHFNCLVGLLDPELYTFSYTRQRSSLLFSSILTISSRIFRPESYSLLREHSESLLGKVLLACDSAIENIWSIVCMYYWKDVGDSRGYALVGFALRLAVSAEWNQTRRRSAFDREEAPKSAESEVQVRQRRDKERIWLALGNIDRTSSYFTDRPLFLAPIARESASRSWLTIDKWTYPLGDGKAIGGFELTKIAQPVYDIMMKSRGHQASGSADAGNLTFKEAVNELNERLTEWGEYWPTIFAQFPGSEPWQVPLIRFFRDYMRLYFNSVLLHRILASNNNDPLHEGAVSTVLVCYSSALSVLRETVQLGKLEVLYYLWDTAHLMTAYAAMMLLKLIKQEKHVPGVSVDEGFKILAEASALHSSAADSLGDTYKMLHSANSLDATPLTAQARLLSAIVFRVKSELRPREPYTGGRADFLSGIQSQTAGPGSDSMNNRDISYPWNDSTGLLGSNLNIHSNTQPQLSMSQLTEDMFFSLESGFIDTMFTDVGLVAWDEPGIFIEPR